MSQSPKTLEFLQKLKDSGNWNDDYDYSKVNFIRTKTKIDVIKNRELVQTILSFGSDVKVLSPKYLVEEITLEISKMSSLY